MERSRESGAAKVVGVGVACLDPLIRVADLNGPILTNKVLDYDVQGGGLVGTALVAVARLGGRAEFRGAVGADALGGQILDGLEAEGVEVTRASRVAGRGPVYLVFVDAASGERRIFRGSRIPDPPAAAEAAVALDGAACLLTDVHQVALARPILREARRLGVPWQEIAAALAEINCTGLLNYEVPGERVCPLSVRRAKLNYLKEVSGRLFDPNGTRHAAQETEEPTE